MIQKPSQVEWLLLILFAATFGMAAYTGCNSSGLKEHTDGEFKILRDSIAMLDDSLKAIDYRIEKIDTSIAKLTRIKSSIKPHFDKEREKARLLPDDSIGASIRSRLGVF